VHRISRFTSLAALTLCFACVGEEPVSEGTGETGGAETETETGDPGEPDADMDGLSDEEEAELGTDPNKADTDDDTYWDSWELNEGTDPLDPNSRIYVGYWPYYPDKDELEQGDWSTASHSLGSQFPRDSFLDQHGDEIEIYDFANYTNNSTGSPAFLIIDVAAQWCGPCHGIADWINGVPSDNADGLEMAYPTVREKIHDRRAWWITFIVQDINGGLPTLADAETWYAQHPDDNIPVLVDDEQFVLDRYGSSQFPFFFLLDPTMAVEFWANAAANEDPFYALALVDQYLE